MSKVCKIIKNPPITWGILEYVIIALHEGELRLQRADDP